MPLELSIRFYLKRYKLSHAIYLLVLLCHFLENGIINLHEEAYYG